MRKVKKNLGFFSEKSIDNGLYLMKYHKKEKGGARELMQELRPK